MSISLAMTMKRVGVIHSTVVIAIWLVLSCGVPVMAEETPSLCKSDEKTFFSCLLTNQKIVSLCGDKSLSQEKGHLQYRFGKGLSSIELEYPEFGVKPVAAFKYYYEPSGAKGSITAVSFKINKYRYSLFDTSSAFGFNGSGLIVRRSGKLVTKMSCKLSLSSEVGDVFYLLKEIGLSGNADDVDYVGVEQ